MPRFRRTQSRIDATEEHIQVFQDQVLDSISSDVLVLITLSGHRATEPHFSGYRSSDSTARNGVICFHCKAKFGWEPTASVDQGQTMSQLEKHLSRTRAIMMPGTSHPSQGQCGLLEGQDCEEQGSRRGDDLAASQRRLDRPAILVARDSRSSGGADSRNDSVRLRFLRGSS